MITDVLSPRYEGTTTSSVPLPSSTWNWKSPFTVAVSRIAALRTRTSAASRRPLSAAAAVPVPLSTGVGIRAPLTRTKGVTSSRTGSPLSTAVRPCRRTESPVWTVPRATLRALR
jgi:hypothetical protein